MEPINPRDDEVRATCNATNVELSIPTHKAANVVKSSTNMLSGSDCKAANAACQSSLSLYPLLSPYYVLLFIYKSNHIMFNLTILFLYYKCQ